MYSHMILSRVHFLLTVLVIVGSIKKCSTLCGNTFSRASAIIIIEGRDDRYIADTCVRSLPIEKFQLLSNTRIILPGTFSSLFRLHTIELNNVGIERVDPGFLENTPSLRTIKIESNSLQSIGRYTFDELRLDTLDVSTNSIHQISNNAFENSVFEYLCLSNNKLTEIKEWFQNTTITALSMTHNLIARLDETTFGGIKGLKSLKLNYNKIESIHPKTFSSINSLQIVYLSGNLLERIDFEIRNNIINIDVSFNRLSYLSLSDYTSLWIMSVYPNPFECNCLRELWKYISKKRIQIWSSKVLKEPWKDENPLCIAKYDHCSPSSQDYSQVRKEYFRIVNYNLLGRPRYTKGEDFVDLGIVN
ncbi:hypothetical protein Trydic_g20726 [Trypoxylus dichotomus]